MTTDHEAVLATAQLSAAKNGDTKLCNALQHARDILAKLPRDQSGNPEIPRPRDFGYTFDDEGSYWFDRPDCEDPHEHYHEPGSIVEAQVCATYPSKFFRVVPSEDGIHVTRYDGPYDTRELAEQVARERTDA